jgi:predicted MPP superfamily phosphohydrolase
MSWVAWTIVGAAAIASAGIGYGWFEAGWLRTRVIEVELRGLPTGLDGLRVAHLSDFHLGMIGRSRGATERAVAWVSERKPDIVCVTGDLVSHPRGERQLRELLRALDRPLVVLGNHDVAVTRDPFSRAAELDDLREALLLRDDATELDVRGVRVQVVGVDPLEYDARTADPARRVDPAAGFRLLLCHFPGIVRRMPAGSFDLVLAGHHHAGQITLPYPGGRLALSHPRVRELAGVFRTPAGVLHVSPGLGTSLLPLRLFARPEVTELVLRTAR